MISPRRWCISGDNCWLWFSGGLNGSAGVLMVQRGSALVLQAFEKRDCEKQNPCGNKCYKRGDVIG